MKSQNSASPSIIESGSLSVALSPEETAGGVAGSVASAMYATSYGYQTVSGNVVRCKMGGQLAWV